MGEQKDKNDLDKKGDQLSRKQREFLQFFLVIFLAFLYFLPIQPATSPTSSSTVFQEPATPIYAAFTNYGSSQFTWKGYSFTLNLTGLPAGGKMVLSGQWDP
jgi:hypothetical protein